MNHDVNHDVRKPCSPKKGITIIALLLQTRSLLHTHQSYKLLLSDTCIHTCHMRRRIHVCTGLHHRNYYSLILAYLHMYVYTYICVCVCMYVCVCVCARARV